MLTVIPHFILPKALLSTVLIVLLYTLSATAAAAGSPALTPVPENPDAPDLTLTDTEGNTHNLADYRGKVVLVKFWATWCAPCRKELPSAQRAWEQVHDQDVVILGVNWKDSEEAIASFRENYTMEFPVLMDQDGSVASQWGVRGLPATFVVDPQGRLAYRGVPGYHEWDDPELLRQLLALQDE